MPIKVLPPDVTSKIAAGEVIERPASVAKELIENSLDAGATEIIIEANNGGVSYLRVSDNGCGLTASEVEIAIKRHATSKITGLKDLEHINTLGFRGEALPSIASVAEVEIITRDADGSAASYLRLVNGAVVARDKKSRPQGTTVIVRRLFQNFPARLKFLKSATTESGHITALVSQFALAYPEVRFELITDGHTSLRTSGDAELRSAVSVIYGLDVAKKMLEVEGTDGFLYIQGLTSPLSVQRSNRSYLSFFVNRRYVRNSLLAKAVETAYEELLMTGRHPLAVINIAIPPEEVDVNVHPPKLEVKFRNNSNVFTAIVKTLRDTLSKSPLPPARPELEDASSRPLWEPHAAEVPAIRPLGQLSASYILAEGEDGLYLIDQHAAHERILFDKIFAQSKEGRPEVQGLLEPLMLELSPLHMQALASCAALLSELGFTIEPFGGNSCLVRAVPSVLSGASIREAIIEILDEAGSEKDKDTRDLKATRLIACHGAIKAGQKLEAAEQAELIRQLTSTSRPRTCPHGRPTMLHLSSQQLKREFGRTQ